MDYYPLVCTLDMILILQYIKKARVESPNLFIRCINSIFFWYLIKKNKTLYCKYLDIELYLFVLI